MTEKVTTRWEVEREHAERDYVRYEGFTVDVTGTFYYAPQRGDDPGECRVEIESVTFQGSPFVLTAAEERRLIEQWGEELRG